MTDIHAASCEYHRTDCLDQRVGSCTCVAAERLAAELEDMTENHNGAHESWKRMHEMCMKAEGDCRALQARLDEAVRLLRRGAVQIPPVVSHKWEGSRLVNTKEKSGLRCEIDAFLASLPASHSEDK